MSKQGYRPEDCAVFCVDGITAGVVKYFSPDISWRDYAHWLRQRRPELTVVHLEQPYDWLELITGLAEPLEKLQHEMLGQIDAELARHPRAILVLGFSLGGLTALQLTHQLSHHLTPPLPEYLAFVTLGTPFRGTGRMQDMLIRHLPQDYFRAMFNVDNTRDYFEQLVGIGRNMQTRILIGEIEGDEVVSASSSLLPVHWLTARPLPAGLKWGTFALKTSSLLRAHDRLLHDPLALGYIDGLVDGLLPPAAEPDQYEPFDPALLKRDKFPPEN
jgi:hypothetical protein